MQEAVLYTGTFDPFHVGHLKQLEFTYAAHPFQKAIVAIIRKNPKKPHATPWQERVALAEIMLAHHNLPFEVEVQPIDAITPDALRKFVDKHFAGYNIFRTTGSDSISEFAEDPNLLPVLAMFHYAVIVRPLFGLKEIQKLASELPQDVRKKFTYEIAHDWGDVLIAGRNLRKNSQLALEQGHITSQQLEYIRQKRLYDLQ